MAQDPNSGEHTSDGGFDWSQLLGPAAAAGTALAGRAITGGGQSAVQSQIPPQLSALLDTSAQRAQYQNPLFQAVSNQAFQGLPSYARQGIAMPSAMPMAPSAAAGGGMPEWLKLLLAGGAGAAGRSLLPGAGSGSGGDIGNLIRGLAKLFGHGDTFGTPGAVSGNDPFGGNLPSYQDPFGAFANDPGGFGATPTDPSGGTGIGPGMQAFYGGSTDPGEE